jgi:pSer/pThr/pTyr-binding forkhead associated (FHA) protein
VRGDGVIRSELATRLPRIPVGPVPTAPNATMVYCRRARERSDDAPARLLVRSGPGAGTVVAVSGDETRLGRGRENDLMLPDISVSRRHALLRRDAGGYVLIDQGSGNGTRVNGRVVEEARLHTGDRILLGDAVVEFLEAGEVAVRGPEDDARAPRSWRGASSAAWAAAAGIVLVASAAAVAPAASRPGARVHAVRRPIPMQAEQSQRSADDPPPLGPLPTPALGARAAEPGSLPTRAAGVQEAQPRSPSKRSRGGGLAAALPATSATASVPALGPVAAVAAAAIADAYVAGDLDGAIDRARAARAGGSAGDVLASLERLAAARREGTALMEQDRTGDAIEALEEAEAEDRALAKGRDGPLGREIRRALSVLHTRAAATADAEAEPGAAAAHLHAALALDAANERAREQLRQLTTRAGDRYLRGYVAKDGDPAAATEAFRWVVAALPASDATAVKARRWLDRLEGKAARED